MSRLQSKLVRFRAQRWGMRCDRGSVLVEFAFASTFVLCMFFAIMEFGYALYCKQYVNEIARDLTRYAIVRGNQCALSSSMPDCGFTDSGTTLTNYVTAHLVYPGLDVNKVVVANEWWQPSTISAKNPTWSKCTGVCNTPGNMVKVSVSYQFPVTIPFWKDQTLNIHSSSSLVISQ